MKILVFGAGEIGKAITQFFLSQNESSQVTLVDINHKQLASCFKHLKKYSNVKKLVMNANRNISSTIAASDLIFICIPWSKHSDIIEHIITYDKPAITVSRPAYHEINTLHAKLNGMTQPIIIGCGLEPGLTEILARYCAGSFDKLDSLHIKCGGITSQPANNRLQYKALFGTNYLPIAMRHAYTVINHKLLKVSRFSDIELVNFPDIGQLEAWHDGMIPWLPTYPEVSSAHTVSQKTLRWPGFAEAVNTLNKFGLLCEKEVPTKRFSISPKEFIEHLYAHETKLNDTDNITLLHIAAEGWKAARLHNMQLMLSITNQPDTGLNSLALITGFTAAIIGLFVLNSSDQHKGLAYPEEIIQKKRVDNLIHQLKNYSLKVAYHA